MSDIKIVNEKGEVEKPALSPFVSGETLEVNPMPKIEEMAVAQIMGVDNRDIHSCSDKVNILLDYAKSQGAKTPEEIKWTVRELYYKIGTPPFGEKPINFASEYAYLLMEGKHIEEAKKKFEK